MNFTKHKHNFIKRHKLSLLFRAIQDILQAGKKYYILFTLSKFIEKMIPFFTMVVVVYIMQQLKEQQTIALGTVLGGYVVVLASLTAIQHWIRSILEVELQVLLYQIELEPAQKLNQLDYEEVSYGKIRRQIDEIMVENEVNPSGLPSIQYRLDAIIEDSMVMLWLLILLGYLIAVQVVLPWYLVAGVVVLLGLIAVVQFFFTKMGESEFEQLSENTADYFSVVKYEADILDDLASCKQIIYSDIKQQFLETMVRRNQQMARQYHAMYTKTVRLSVYGRLAIFLLSIFIYSLMAMIVFHQLVTLVVIIPLIDAINQFVQVIPNYLISWTFIRSDLEYLEKYYAYMDSPMMVKQSLEPSASVENLMLENVHYHYAGSEQFTLGAINLALEKGKAYAVVGQNGSGKTTLMNIVQGLIKPTEGRIYAQLGDNQQLEVNTHGIFSAVQQDFSLYHFTVRDNIILHEPFDQNSYQKALANMELVERLYKMEDKDATFIGKEYVDNGVFLSGGEQQRILLARILYHQKPIIVLDEPTSDLDAKIELAFYKKMKELVKDHTIIFVSHRLASCQFCDEIIVMDQGKIVQKGTHDVLMKSKGMYQTLWESQKSLYQ